MIDILKKIKKECEMHAYCVGCPLSYVGKCLLNGFNPCRWDTDAIRKALGEEPKNKIIVPEKWTGKTIHEMNVNGELTREIIGKQNGIIDCLKQIKERLDERT